MSDDIIVLKDLSKIYGNGVEVRALDGVSVKIKAGEFVSRRPIMLSSVLFPLPLGPTMATNSPALIFTLTPSKARTSTPFP